LTNALFLSITGAIQTVPDASDILFTVTCAARTSFRFSFLFPFLWCPSSHWHCATL